MPHDNFPPELIAAVKSFLWAITPAALGSAVYQLYQKGLSWRERLTQFVVGICVSYFVTDLVVGMLGWGEFASQGVGFVVALFAFEATPKFVRGAVDVVGSLPATLRDRFLARKDKPDA